jgi:AAA domain
LTHAAEAGAKVVLVGDPQQLQAIEAGAAFRWVHERHGGAALGEVRRQREDWQREATKYLATGSTGDAIHAYDRHGMVHETQTREEARSDLIERWDRDRQASPDQTRIILTHTNDEVRALNEAARERLRVAGDLGDDLRLTVARGTRSFASGDRVMFLQNDRGLGVKNGTLGVIVQVDAQSMTVRTDDGRSVAFYLKDYDHIDHGYAATIHKAQGMTVDHTYVLATPGMDAHGSYVALSRHRDGIDLHYGRDDFAGHDRLVRTLSRDRAKDMVSDYERLDPAQDYAERRGIAFRARAAEIMRKLVPERLREAVDGLLDGVRPPGDAAPGPEVGPRPEREDGRRVAVGPAQQGGEARRAIAAPERTAAEDREPELRKARTRALIRHARAVDAIHAASDADRRESPDQMRELTDARKAFEEARPYGWQDAEASYARDPDLALEAGMGRVNRAIRALQLETELRVDPAKNPSWRADRFVERWQKLDQTSQHQYRAGDMSGYHSTRSAMGDMAKSLQRDPQLESILSIRKAALGIQFDSGRRLGAELAFNHGIDLGRERGPGL